MGGPVSEAMARRRIKILKEMLRALQGPLALARGLQLRMNRLGAKPAVRDCIDSLIKELSFAVRDILREINSLGSRRPRSVQWVRVSRSIQARWAGATAWASLLRDACRGCARRLCKLVGEAQMIADTSSARIAFGTLRALEKLLCLLQYHAGAPDTA